MDNATGVNPESQEQNTEGQDNQNAAGEQYVPVSVVQSIRSELKDAKERAKQAEQMVQQSSQTGQDQAAQDPLGDVSDDEFLTAGQARKVLQQQQQMSREMELRSQTPDYDEVVQNYVPKLVQEKPHLRDAIASSQDPYSLAYELGKTYKERQTSEGKEDDSGQTELDKHLENVQNKPGSVSQTAQGGGAAPQNSGVGLENSVDLESEIQKVKRGR